MCFFAEIHKFLSEFHAAQLFNISKKKKEEQQNKVNEKKAARDKEKAVRDEARGKSLTERKEEREKKIDNQEKLPMDILKQIKTNDAEDQIMQETHERLQTTQVAPRTGLWNKLQFGDKLISTLKNKTGQKEGEESDDITHAKKTPKKKMGSRTATPNKRTKIRMKRTKEQNGHSNELETVKELDTIDSEDEGTEPTAPKRTVPRATSHTKKNSDNVRSGGKKRPTMDKKKILPALKRIQGSSTDEAIPKQLSEKESPMSAEEIIQKRTQLLQMAKEQNVKIPSHARFKSMDDANRLKSESFVKISKLMKKDII